MGDRLLEAVLDTGSALPHVDGWEFNQPYEEFKYDQYDWSNFKGDYVPLRLSKGYFACVSPADLSRLSKYKWYANVQKDSEGRVVRVYARRTTAIKGKHVYVYMHRAVISTGLGLDTDHKNNLGLDNRRCNLIPRNRGHNNANATKAFRTIKLHLKRGVEVRSNGNFGGIIKCRGKNYRSKKTWKTQERAHQWYLNRHKEFYGHCENVSPEKKVAPLIFPRLKKQLASREVEADLHPIPF